MEDREVRPYGSWRSPISAAQVAREAGRLGETAVHRGRFFWLERRPLEGGRNALMGTGPNGEVADLLPPPWNVRTRVHEYGGGGYCLGSSSVFFVHFEDQRLYRLPLGETEPMAVTASEPGLLLADLTWDESHQRLLAIAERHSGSSEPENLLIAIDPETGSWQPLVVGRDFVSTPRPSLDGSKLAWLAWDHPHMPWDSAELWCAEVEASGALAGSAHLAGSDKESVFQPEWDQDGSLYFVSDRSGWWNLYRLAARGKSLAQTSEAQALAPRTAEFGLPQWVFGMSTYAVLAPGEIVCTFCEGGVWRLGTLFADSEKLEVLDTGYTKLEGLRCDESLKAGEGCSEVLLLAASPERDARVVRYRLGAPTVDEIYALPGADPGPRYTRQAEPIEVPTPSGRRIHAFFYAPWNADFRAPETTLPLLLVKSHGGPTAACDNTFQLGIQFWTSRGFAVVDVNYAGSTGFGRAYREALDGQWGIVDVDDCERVALWLADRGRVDGKRLAIRGGSAGGYTTLAALTFRDTFRAGASHYGIGDLESLARDTHKFESRYLDGLVAPYPERADLYRERSPIHHADQLSCPVIFFQGLEDKVVPPAQAEAMYSALEKKGVAVAYVPFAGEQHGFRKAENIERALEAELYFYSRVFGFELATPIEPVSIANLDEAEHRGTET